MFEIPVIEEEVEELEPESDYLRCPLCGYAMLILIGLAHCTNPKCENYKIMAG